MNRSAMGVAILGLLASAPASPRSIVRVTPVFWAGQETPAFKVECTNTSKSSRSTLNYVSKSALRFDSTLHEMGIVSGSFMGTQWK